MIAIIGRLEQCKPIIILLCMSLSLVNATFGCNTSPNNDCASAQPISQNGSLSCIDGCTEGASSGYVSTGTGGCSETPFATTWYTINNGGNNAMLDIGMESNEIDNAVISIYSGSCNSLNYEYCNQGRAGLVDLVNVPLQPNTTYYIAISSSDGTEGAYDMCTRVYNDPSTCNTTGKIQVVNTSLGSPLSGPFQPNETIEFCYTQENYFNSNTNYLHGIVPTFGDGWAANSFSANGAPQNITTSLTTQGSIYSQTQDPICEGDLSGSWNWYDSGVVTYETNNPNTLGLSNGDPAGAGWYFLNSFDPDCFSFEDACCTNPTTDPNLGYGDDDYPAYSGQGSWRVCFTLQTISLGECSSEVDASVSIKTFGDSETGIFTNTGCLEDPLIVFNTSINCCTSPTLSISENNIEICKENNAEVEISSSDPTAAFYWINDQTGEVNYSNETPGLFSEYFPNPGTYTYTVYASNSCVSDPKTITINVTGDFEVVITQSPENPCPGDEITLTASVDGFSDLEFEWDDNASSTSSSIIIDDNKDSYNVTVSRIGCANSGNYTVIRPTEITASISGNESTCAGESVDLNFTLEGAAPWTITYQDQSGTINTITTTDQFHIESIVLSEDKDFTLVSVQDAGGCESTISGEANYIIVPASTPEFSFEKEICDTDPIFTLPTISDNGISGTWSPAEIDPSLSINGKIDATFSPDNICDKEENVEFKINFSDTPTFDLPQTMCTDESPILLPTVSDNSISGTWNIFEVNPSGNAGQLINIEFTPTDDLCARTFNASIEVVAKQIPSFDLPETLCANDEVLQLPTSDENNIEGFWNVNEIDPNDVSGSSIDLTFTPFDSKCTELYSTQIEIKTAIEISFDLPAEYCAKQGVVTLPTTDENGVEGFWDTPMIDTDLLAGTTVFSTFTPSNIDCPKPYELIFDILEEKQVEFDLPLSLCSSDDVLNLSNVSDNGIEGTWNIDDINPQDYIGQSIDLDFIPNDECAEIFFWVININSNVEPEFSLPNLLCDNEPELNLPTISDNGIEGEWSIPTILPIDYSGNSLSIDFVVGGDCSTNYTLELDVLETIIPEFSLETELCISSPIIDLPLTSDNGILGTWSESTIDPNSITAGNSLEVAFIPDASNKCAERISLTFSVSENSIPEFSLPSSLCSSADELILPELSNNGINGSWNVNSIDPTQESGSVELVFSSTDDCTDMYMTTIEILDSVTPEFDFPNQLCEDAAPISLPNLSNGGIPGTWDLSEIDPSDKAGETIVAKFTPDNTDCTAETTFNFEILSAPNVQLDKRFEVCNGAEFQLSDIVITDVGSSNSIKTFHSSTPAEASNEIIASSIIIDQYTEIIVLAKTGDCFIEHIVEIESIENPELKIDNAIASCENEMISLNDIPVYENNGNVIELSYHSGIPDNSNAFTDDELMLSNGTQIYALARIGDCESVLEIPLDIQARPVLEFNDEINICKSASITLTDILVNEISGQNNPITFHTEAEPSEMNRISEDEINPTEDMSIFASSEIGDCRDVIEIPIKVTDAPELVVSTQPVICDGQSLRLEDIALSDINSTGILWTFHSDLPIDASNQITDTELSPTTDLTIYAFADAGDCSDNVEISISVNSSLNAGEDNSIDLCSDFGLFDVNSLVSADADPGVWSEFSNAPFFNEVTNMFDVSASTESVYNFSYVVSANGSCAPDTAWFELRIAETEDAGISSVQTICQDAAEKINLYDVIGISNTGSGIWTQLSGDNIDITNPTETDFSLVTSGEYTFEYKIDATDFCEEKSSTATVEVFAKPNYTIVETSCSVDLQSYNVTINSVGNIVNTDVGELIGTAGVYAIENIAIENSVNVSIINNENCEVVFAIDPPSCDCPSIPEPISNGDLSICDLSELVELTVSESADYTVEWFDEITGGNSLGLGTTYLPVITTPGVYDYYVSFADNNNPECKSLTRTKVTLEYNEKPQEENINFIRCREVGGVNINLDEVLGNVALNPTYTVNYFNTITDAEQNVNVLPADFIMQNDSDLLFAKITNDKACFTIIDLQLELVDTPEFSLSKTDLSCADLPDGEIRIEVSDPTGLEFSIDGINWVTDLVFTGLPSGDYEVESRNGNSCKSAETITLNSSVSFTIESSAIDCNDDGTPETDDDFYDITILVESENTSSQYELVDGTNLIGVFDYGELQDFTILADGQNHILAISDVNDPNCNDFINLGILETCSVAACQINSGEITNIICSDNETPFDATDDTFTFDIIMQSSNGSSSWESTDGVYAGEYGSVVTVESLAINEATGTIQIQDTEDSSCSFELTYQIPASCSSACEISVSVLELSDCDNNETEQDDTDDLVNATISVLNSNSGNASFFVDYNAERTGPFNYGDSFEVLNIASNGLDQTIILTDTNDLNCAFELVINNASCSNCNESTSIEADLNLDCANTPVRPIVNSSSIGNVLWTGPDSNDFYSDELEPEFIQSGTYTISVTHSNGCVSTSSLTVNQNNEKPTLLVGDDQEINCYNEFAFLTAEANANNSVLYYWYDENDQLVSTDEIFAAGQEGVYKVIAIDQTTLCESEAGFITVIEDKQAPSMDILTMPTNVLTCNNDVVSLTPDGDLSGYEISWFIDGVEFSGENIDVNEPGEITIEILDLSNGCVQNTSVMIEENLDMPQVNLTLNDIIDCENSSVFISSEGSSVGSDVNYQWYDENKIQLNPSSTETLEASDPGMYFLEISFNSSGCSIMDSVTVVANLVQPEIEVENIAILNCNDSSLQLNAEMMSNTANYEIQWSSDANQQISNGEELTPIVYASGNYTIQVIDLDNHCKTTDMITVVDDPNAILDAEIVLTDPVCFGDENGIIEIMSVNSQGTNLQYSINELDAQSNETFDGLAPAIYDVEIVNDAGCKFTDQVELLAPQEIGLTLNVDEVLNVNLGDEINLEAIVNLDEENLSLIQWTHDGSIDCDDCLTTIATPINSTSYEITVMDENGCLESRSVLVAVSDEVEIYVPNIFSPNDNDGNNKFMIYGKKQVENISYINIYDRWGNVVFENVNFQPEDESAAWDGFSSDRKVSPGVYAYIFEAELINGEKKIFKGDITILY